MPNPRSGYNKSVSPLADAAKARLPPSTHAWLALHHQAFLEGYAIERERMVLSHGPWLKPAEAHRLAEGLRVRKQKVRAVMFLLYAE